MSQAEPVEARADELRAGRLLNGALALGAVLGLSLAGFGIVESSSSAPATLPESAIATVDGQPSFTVTRISTELPIEVFWRPKRKRHSSSIRFAPDSPNEVRQFLG